MGYVEGPFFIWTGNCFKLMKFKNLLFVFLLFSLTVTAETIIGFRQVRYMNDTTQLNWLVETTYKIPLDSTFKVLKVWAAEKENAEEWHDFLFLKNEIANFNWGMRNYDAGILRLDSVVQLFIEHNDTLCVEYAYTHKMYSQLYMSSDKYIPAYERSLNVMRKINHHSTLFTDCLFFLSSSYYAAEDRSSALACLVELDKETEFEPMTRINTDVLVAKQFADFQPYYAIDLMKQTIEKIDSLKNGKYKGYKGAYTISLGRYYNKVGEVEKSNRCYFDALKIFEGSGDFSNLFVSYQNLTNNYIREKQYDLAKVYLAKADSLSVANNFGKNRVLELYAYMYEEQGELDSAMSYYKKAIDEVRESKGDYYFRLGDLNGIISRFCLEKEDFNEALFYATRAINTFNYDSIIKPNEAPMMLPSMNKNNTSLKVLKPLKYYIAAISNLPTDTFVEHIYRAEEYMDTVLSNAMNYVVEGGEIMSARKFALSAYNISLQLKVDDFHETASMKSAFSALNTADGLKNGLLLFDKKRLHSQFMNSDSIDFLISELEIKLRSASAASDSNLIALQITDLKSVKFQRNMRLILEDKDEYVRVPKLEESLLDRIPKETSLVEYHLDDSLLCCFVLNRGDVKIVRVKTGADFPKLLNTALREVKSNTSQMPSLEKLSQLLIAPIQHLLRKNIVFIADENFALFPLELLKKKDDFIIEAHAVSYSYSINLWLENQKMIKVDKDYSVLAVAPTFENSNNELLAQYRGVDEEDNAIFRGDALAELPYSRMEVEGIYTAFKNQGLACLKYTGSLATEQNLRLGLDAYSIVHLATHGVVSKVDNYKTGLFLSSVSDNEDYMNNGFISMQELFNIKVSANLVVLSTCQSAYGKVASAEGVISLPRSFIYAGVPNVIASLWKVHDERTQYLMLRFYDHLLKGKKSYSEALRQAKLDCIKKDYLPMDWASFILIGE